MNNDEDQRFKPHTSESTECSHDLCNCTITGPLAGESFCSHACKYAVENGIESETCPCSHPQCDVP